MLTQGSDHEANIATLIELGFDRAPVIQEINIFNGNEEQSVGFLFGGCVVNESLLWLGFNRSSTYWGWKVDAYSSVSRYNQD